MEESVIPDGGVPAGPPDAGMRSVLDPLAPATRRLPAGAIAPGALPPVAAVVIDPDVTVAQLLNHASGPPDGERLVLIRGGNLHSELLMVEGALRSRRDD